MKLSLLILFLSIFFSRTTSAQHCPYGGAKIMVLKVYSKKNADCIPSLKITVLDSLNQPITFNIYTSNGYQLDSLKFWQNPKTTTHSGIVDNNHPLIPEQFRFWFAEDNYTLVHPYFKGMQIRIEDIDGKENGGLFKSTLFTPSKKDAHPLCTSHSSWDEGPEGGFVQDYEPMQVRLKRKRFFFF